jgi:TRAP-type uncharacterized transport system substrate-binding protein
MNEYRTLASAVAGPSLRKGDERMQGVAVFAFAAGVTLGCWAGAWPAASQSIPKSLQQRGTEAEVKARKNTWTVGVAGGLLSGTYMRFADELAQALDDGDNLRILPIVSYGAASNLEDLLYLRGVDVAVTQSDVFEYFRTEGKISNLENRVHYVLRLPISELHVLARKEVRSLEDLRGKKVSFGPAGAGSSLTGPIVFQRLGIEVEQLFLDNPNALQKLRSGEIAALVRSIGKPIEFFSRLPADAGFHLVPIPFTQKFADYYTLGEFTSREYPTLVPEGQKTDTIAVPAVLAVYNWPKGSDRYRRVERFVERLFANWEKFQKPPYHPKWRDINLAATVPGWNQFAVAGQMLQRTAAAGAPSQDELNSEFQRFLGQSGARAPSKKESEALFREFLQWRNRQGTARR